MGAGKYMWISVCVCARSWAYSSNSSNLFALRRVRGLQGGVKIIW